MCIEIRSCLPLRTEEGEQDAHTNKYSWIERACQFHEKLICRASIAQISILKAVLYWNQGVGSSFLGGVKRLEQN